MAFWLRGGRASSMAAKHASVQHRCLGLGHFVQHKAFAWEDIDVTFVGQSNHGLPDRGAGETEIGSGFCQ